MAAGRDHLVEGIGEGVVTDVDAGLVPVGVGDAGVAFPSRDMLEHLALSWLSVQLAGSAAVSLLERFLDCAVVAFPITGFIARHNRVLNSFAARAVHCRIDGGKEFNISL